MSKENHLKGVLEFIKSINLETASRGDLVFVMESLPVMISASSTLVDSQILMLELELSAYRAENKKNSLSISPKKQVMTMEQLETIAFDPKTPEKEAKKALRQLLKLTKVKNPKH